LKLLTIFFFAFQNDLMSRFQYEIAILSCGSEIASSKSKEVIILLRFDLLIEVEGDACPYTCMHVRIKIKIPSISRTVTITLLL
jgi:hypothetical protein